MDIKEVLKTHITTATIGVLSGAIGFCLLRLVGPVWHPLAQYVLPHISVAELLWLSLLLLLSNIATLAFLLSQRKPKLQPKYGVYWDKTGNAFCPASSCRSLLVHRNICGFICVQCNPEKVIYLMDSWGDPVSIPKALKELRISVPPKQQRAPKKVPEGPAAADLQH